MYAIVEIGGSQYRVTKDMKLKVPSINAEPGKKVSFDSVLAVEDDKGNFTFGTPLLTNTSVSATIIEHGRHKKIIVFKKKRRKGYQKKNGHRQSFTLIEINNVGASAKPAKKAAVKSESKKEPVAEKKQVAAKKPTAKVAPKKKTAAKPKSTIKKEAAPAAKKTTVAKKPAAKKAVPKAKKKEE